MECKFCKNTFINKYKLERHQRTAQFCIDLQKINVEERTCLLCKKIYSTEKELKEVLPDVTKEQMLDAYASIGMPIFYKHWSFFTEIISVYFISP